MTHPEPTYAVHFTFDQLLWLHAVSVAGMNTFEPLSPEEDETLRRVISKLQARIEQIPVESS